MRATPMISFVLLLLLATSVAPVRAGEPSPKKAALAQLRATIRSDSGLVAHHTSALIRAAGRAAVVGIEAGLVSVIPSVYVAKSAKQIGAGMVLGAAVATALSYVRTNRRVARTQTAEHAYREGKLNAEQVQRLRTLDIIE